MNKILKAIQKGVKSGLLESGFNFSLDDLDHIEDYGLKKKKLDRQFFKDEFDKQTVAYYKENPPIKVGDILYSNYELDRNGYLKKLGDEENGDPIAVCVIQPYFLLDEEIRFMSIEEPKDFICFKDDYMEYGYDDWSVGYFYVDNNRPIYDGEKLKNPYNGKNKFNMGWTNNIPETTQFNYQGWINAENILKDPDADTYIAIKNSNDYNNYNENDDNLIDWYLPSIGELGIMVAKETIINNALKKANGQSLNNNFLLSSTVIPKNDIPLDEDDTEEPQYVYACSLYDGECQACLFDSTMDHRPFCHMKLSPEFNR